MGKDDAYWLRISYILFGVIVAYVFYSAFLTLGIQTNWIEKYDSWYDVAAIGASVVLAFGVSWAVTSDKERHEYYLASIGELRKVTWPSYIDTRRMTVVVVVVVGIFSVILAGFDSLWSWLLGLMLA